MSSSGGINYGKLRLLKKIVDTHWNVKAEEKKYSFNELVFVLNALLEYEGKPYLEGGKGRFSRERGFNNFRMFAEHLLYRNCANFDSMVLMTGPKGTGKSSAAIMLAREWCKLIGIRFNPRRHIAYNNSDLMQKIELLNKFEPIIADESVRFASGADWARKENKELKKKLAQVRTRHLLYILCFPLKIYKLESTYLQSYVNYWVEIYARGQSAVFIRDSNPVADSWKLKDFLKIGSYNEFTPIEKVKQRLSKHSNFWTMMKLPKPPIALYNKYLAVREKNVYNDPNVMANVSKEDIYNALLILALQDIMSHDSTLSINRVILHIKNEYDMYLSKTQVNSCVDDAKQLIKKIKEQAIDINQYEKLKSLSEVDQVAVVDGSDIKDQVVEKPTEQATINNEKSRE